MTPLDEAPEQRWRRTVDRRNRPAKLKVDRLLRDFGYAELDPEVGAAIEARLAGVALAVAPSLRNAVAGEVITLYANDSPASEAGRPVGAPAAERRSVEPVPAAPEPVAVADVAEMVTYLKQQVLEARAEAERLRGELERGVAEARAEVERETEAIIAEQAAALQEQRRQIGELGAALNATREALAETRDEIRRAVGELQTVPEPVAEPPLLAEDDARAASDAAVGDDATSLSGEQWADGREEAEAARAADTFFAGEGAWSDADDFAEPGVALAPEDAASATDAPASASEEPAASPDAPGPAVLEVADADAPAPAVEQPPVDAVDSPPAEVGEPPGAAEEPAPAAEEPAPADEPPAADGDEPRLAEVQPLRAVQALHSAGDEPPLPAEPEPLRAVEAPVSDVDEPPPAEAEPLRAVEDPVSDVEEPPLAAAPPPAPAAEEPAPGERSEWQPEIPARPPEPEPEPEAEVAWLRERDDPDARPAAHGQRSDDLDVPLPPPDEWLPADLRPQTDEAPPSAAETSVASGEPEPADDDRLTDLDDFLYDADELYDPTVPGEAAGTDTPLEAEIEARWPDEPAAALPPPPPPPPSPFAGAPAPQRPEAAGRAPRAKALRGRAGRNRGRWDGSCSICGRLPLENRRKDLEAAGWDLHDAAPACPQCRGVG